MSDLVVMGDFVSGHPIKIDLVYAQAGHPENIFKEAIYRGDAPFVLHRDLAAVTLHAAHLLREVHGWTLVLKDGLRPVEAQMAIVQTDIVRANPHWLEEPRLFSPPGQGGHPRGMAVDVSVEDDQGRAVDMGTVFDTMDARSARSYEDFAEEILSNRVKLESAFTEAGHSLHLPLKPLSSEWWDFRFTQEHYNQYEPISEADLPDALKMMPCQTGDIVR